MRKLSTILNESYGTEITDKISGKYDSAKRDLLDIIARTNGNTDLQELKKVLKKLSYFGLRDIPLNGLNNENDIYDYYLEHDTDIDDILNNNEYFNRPPSEMDIFSLYGYIIEGTRNAFQDIAIDLLKDLGM